MSKLFVFDELQSPLAVFHIPRELINTAHVVSITPLTVKNDGVIDYHPQINIGEKIVWFKFTTSDGLVYSYELDAVLYEEAILSVGSFEKSYFKYPSEEIARVQAEYRRFVNAVAVA